MSDLITTDAKQEFLKRGFTRRNFGRITSMLAAGAALPFYNESAMAQLSMLNGPMPADAVKINANENPLGPCPEAAEAIYSVVKKGGRYMYEETFGFAYAEGLNVTRADVVYQRTVRSSAVKARVKLSKSPK